MSDLSSITEPMKTEKKLGIVRSRMALSERCRHGWLITMLLISALMLLDVTVACGAEPEFDFDIPASTADKALVLFAKQADIQILFPFDIVSEIQLNELFGKYTIKEGIKILTAEACLKVEENFIKGLWKMEIKKCQRHKVTAAVSKAIILATAVGALAVDAQEFPERQRVEHESQRVGLEEIIVTARKRNENLQRVPMSVVALNAAQLEIAQIANITDLERVTPNITISDTGGLVAGAVSVFVRGIGNDPGLDQGVGIYIDDVYLNRTTGALLETYDIERIEVLKGPQGNLYGRNTIGGAIKYITRRPGDDFRVDIQAKIGSYDLKQYKGNISGPLVSDRVYGSFGFITKNSDGIQRNISDGKGYWSSDYQGYRGSLLIKPTDHFSAYLSADYGKDVSSPRLPNRVAVDAAMLSGIDFVISGANNFLGIEFGAG